MLGAEGMDPRVYIRRLRDPLHRNSIVLILNSIIPSFWGLAFWLIVARVYPAGDVGVATAIFPTAGLIASLATLGFSIGLMRFLPNQGVRAREVINSTVTLSSLLALLGAMGFALVAPYWSKSLQILGENPIFGAAFVLYTFAAAGSLLVDSALIARSKAGYVFLKTNVFGLSRIPLPIILFLAGSVGSLAIFVSFSLAIFVAFILGLIYLLPRVYLGYKFRPSVQGKDIMPMMRFSLLNHVANIIALVPGAIIPLLVLKWMSAVDAAYYYAAWLGAGIVFSVSVSASTSLLAVASQSEAALERNTRKAWAFVLALQIPAVIICLVLADVLLNLFQQGYSAGGTALRLFALSSFFVAFNNIYVTRKRVEKINWAVVGVVLLQSCLNVLLALALIPTWGLTGIGVAFLVSQALTSGVIAASRLAIQPTSLGSGWTGSGDDPGKKIEPD